MKAKRLDVYCAECGSRNVSRDAAAAWNIERQEWELVTVYDKGATCEECEDETTLREVDLNDEEAEPRDHMCVDEETDR